MRVVTGQLAPNDFCVERTEGSLAVVRRGVSGRYRTASAVPLQPEQPFGDGRYAVPHPKLDDRVRLSSQFPQLVAVFVDVGLRAARLVYLQTLMQQTERCKKILHGQRPLST